MYVVIGISPFHDTSVAAGPYRSEARAEVAREGLTLKGWNAEVVELTRTEDVPTVRNDEE
jgi:hypothetical protein